MYMEMNDDCITKFEKYKTTEEKHGKLEKVEKNYLDELNDALLNFSDTTYDMEPARKIMYEHIKDKYPKNTIADFGCCKLAKDTLVLTLR
jgi:hypothetical protein